MDDSYDKDLSIHRHVIFSSLTNYIGKIIPLGAGFFLTPFILGHLGELTYGIWALVGSVIQYGSLLDLGISTAVVKYVAEHRAKNEMKTASALVSTALLLYGGLGALAIGISIAVAPLFPRIFQTPPQESLTVSTLVILMGVNVGIALPCSITTAVLRGLQRFDLANILAVTGTLISVGATVFVLEAGGGILGMVAIGIPLTLLMQIPGVMIVRRVCPSLQFPFGHPQSRLAGRVLGYSSATFLIELGGQLQSRTDTIVVGLLLPVANVTPYSFAQRLSTIPQILTDQFMKVLLPLASELHAEDDSVRLRGLYIAGTRLALALFLPIGTAMVLLAGPILSVWVGPKYANYSYLVVILTLAVVIDTALWPAGSVLQGMARQKLLAVLTTASAILNLALSVVLVQRIGLAGVAIGTLIPTTLEAVCVFAYASRSLHVEVTKIFSEILWPVSLPLVPASCSLLLFHFFFPSDSLLVLALSIVTESLIYVLVYLRFGAGPSERRTYDAIATKAVQTVKAWT